MFGTLLSKGQTLAEERRRARIDRLASESPPPGVIVAQTEEGIVLSGRRLRRRLVTDAALRSFGR